jgi:hypothetical protein
MRRVGSKKNGYSYLNASIGSRVEARRAGHSPKKSPTAAEKPSALLVS